MPNSPFTCSPRGGLYHHAPGGSTGGTARARRRGGGGGPITGDRTACGAGQPLRRNDSGERRHQVRPGRPQPVRADTPPLTIFGELLRRMAGRMKSPGRDRRPGLLYPQSRAWVNTPCPALVPTD
ncbi:MAG: hypothetical protein MZV64_70560 [Ignavibacteriales bacterium]|nr:hypothetical protein [Ignavibacteriales bacterium]